LKDIIELAKHKVRNSLNDYEKPTTRRQTQPRKSTRTKTKNIPMNMGLLATKRLNEIENSLLRNHKLKYLDALKLDEDLNKLPDETINELQTGAFIMKTNANPNILGHSAAMKAEDADKFHQSMKLEMDRLTKHEVFDIIDIENIPKNTKILRAIWSHRRKTNPGGEVYKHKSRICADGSQQEEGIDFDETFSPVVSWSTVRLILILAMTKDLKMRQIDYVQAFTQAELEDDV